MSVDGKIALPTKVQTAISTDEDLRRVHELRANCDCILIGIGTILADDPSLTVKQAYVPGARNPTRIVLDSMGRTPVNAKVLDSRAKTIIAVSERCRKGEIGNAELVRCGKDRVDLGLLMKELGKRKLKNLLVEGGGSVIWSFLDAGLFDELNVYIGNMVIGSGPTLADGSMVKSLDETVKLRLAKVEQFGDGVLLKYLPAR